MADRRGEGLSKKNEYSALPLAFGIYDKNGKEFNVDAHHEVGCRICRYHGNSSLWLMSAC